MRRDVQEIFRATPHHKQVMMFSATLAKDIRATCKKFMANVCPYCQRLILLLIMVAAFGNLCRRRNKAYVARSSATLREARRSWQEPETQRIIGFSGIQSGISKSSFYLLLLLTPASGCDFCKVGRSRD